MPNGYQSNYTAFLDASTDDGAYVDPANAMYKLGQDVYKRQNGFPSG